MTALQTLAEIAFEDQYAFPEIHEHKQNEGASRRSQACGTFEALLTRDGPKVTVVRCADDLATHVPR